MSTFSAAATWPGRQAEFAPDRNWFGTHSHIPEKAIVKCAPGELETKRRCPPSSLRL
jgi:hypothetical protein